MMKEIVATFASVMPGLFKKALYRMIGYKIGRNVRIGFLTLILAKKVDIGDNVKIGSLNILKGNKIEIGRNSIIRSLNMIIGPRSFKAGRNTQIVGPYTFMNLSEDIEIDDYCGIGSHSVFYTHGVYLPYTEGNPRKFGKIYLGKRVWSPAHVIFLPGVNVGDDSIIMVGSVVNNSFPEDSLISGNPAKRVSKASYLKSRIDGKEFRKRVNEIIYDFSRDVSLEGSKIVKKEGGLIIKKGKKEFLIAQEDKKFNSDRYSEVIVLGKNLRKRKGNVSLFDFESRESFIKGDMARNFKEHLGTFGESFEEV